MRRWEDDVGCAARADPRSGPPRPYGTRGSSMSRPSRQEDRSASAPALAGREGLPLADQASDVAPPEQRERSRRCTRRAGVMSRMTSRWLPDHADRAGSLRRAEVSCGSDRRGATFEEAFAHSRTPGRFLSPLRRRRYASLREQPEPRSVARRGGSRVDGDCDGECETWETTRTSMLRGATWELSVAMENQRVSLSRWLKVMLTAGDAGGVGLAVRLLSTWRRSSL